LDIQFTGDGFDPDGGPVTFDWDFGDGNTSTEQSPLHVYGSANAPGAYRASLTVTDQPNTSTEVRLPLTITESGVLAGEIVDPAAGGDVTVANLPQNPLNGASISVPANALSGPRVFTICAVSEVLPLPRATMGTLLQSIELGPTGMTFSQPITVSVPVDANVDPTREFVVVYYDRESGTWSGQGITNIHFVSSPSPAVVFETTHFTVFAAGVTWQLKHLGGLGGVDSYAFGINNSDRVAGYSYVFVAANHRHAFQWQDATGIVDLGTLGRKHSYAFDLNDNGQITGYLQPSDSFDGSTAFIWDEQNGLQDLDDFGGIYSMGFDINAIGQIAGQVYITPVQRHAFLWNPVTGVADLGTLGGTSSYALGINDAGTVVGAAQTAAGEFHAFVWTLANGMQDLGTLGGTFSQAEAINASGVIAGGANNASGKRRAFLWDLTSGMQDLGVLDADSSHALGINASNQVVGFVQYPDATTHAFYWERENAVDRMFDLNDFIDSDSGTVLTEAQDINNAGNIAGREKEKAFLLRR